MDNRRGEPRATSYAGVVLAADQTVGHVRDLSRDGCRMSFLERPDLQGGQHATVTILPSEETGIHGFQATLEVRWCRKDGPAWFVGGMLEPAPADRAEWERLLLYFHKTGSP